MFIFQGYRDKVHSLGGLKNDIYCPNSSEGQKPKSKLSAGYAPSGTLSGILPCLFMSYAGGQPSPPFPGWQLPHSSLCLRHHVAVCSLCVSLSSS